MSLFYAAAISCLLRRSEIRDAANEAAPDEESVIGAANELRMDGDWVLLAPYGDFDNRVGMQRFQREDAQNAVNEFKRILNLPNRMLGLPWYVGHPDHAAFSKRDTDISAKGRIKDLQARDDGLYARVKWSSEGKRLIEEEAFAGHSVNWNMRKQGAVWRPFSLNSVGFTNNPGIPVPPVTAANEDETKTKGQVMPPWLLELLGLPAEATEEQVRAKLNEMKQGASTGATAANELQQVRTELATVRQERDEAKNKLTTAETTAANERKLRAGMILDSAIADGRVTAAERPQLEQAFANEFDATAEKVKQLQPKLNTKSKTGDLNQRQVQHHDRAVQVATAVNEKMKAAGLGYHDAWLAVKREKPDLFEQMQQPEAVVV